MDIDQIFGGVAGARAGGAPKIFMETNSEYLVELQDIRAKASEKPGKKGAPVFICAFKIVESSTPKHAPGSDGSWSLSGAALEYGLGDIKQLFFAIIGVTSRDATPAHDAAAGLFVRYVLGSPQAKAEIDALPPEQRPAQDFYKSTRVRLSTKTKVNKTDATKSFTQHYWSPAPKPS